MFGYDGSTMDRVHAANSATATVGFAAGPAGSGVAYAALVGADGRESLVRVGFASPSRPALRGRDVAYAALEAVARALLARGVRRVEVRIDDLHLPVDLAERRALPPALEIPYVALRCALNRFACAEVVVATEPAARDLTARARAEASLGIAA
jgi:hypothetical protein